MPGPRGTKSSESVPGEKLKSCSTKVPAKLFTVPEKRSQPLTVMSPRASVTCTCPATNAVPAGTMNAKLSASMLPLSPGKQRFLTDDEIARLLAASAESRNKVLRAMVTVDLHTGLRKGEPLGLTWEQVDFARNVIALGRRTKSGKGRDVPINQAVYDAPGASPQGRRRPRRRG